MLWFAPVGVLTPKLLPTLQQHPVARFILFDFVGATADRVFDVVGVSDLQQILGWPVPPQMVVMTTDNRHNARVRTFRFDKQMVVATHLKCSERCLDFGSIQGTLEPFKEPHGAFQALLEHGSIGLFTVLTGRFGVQLNVNALVVLRPFYCPQRLHLHMFVTGEEAQVEIVGDKAWLREFPRVNEVRAPAIHSNNELVH